MLYAKRHYEDDILIEESIEQHIDNTLEILYQLENVYPELFNKISCNKINGKEIAFIAVSFHDLGKCTKQFQSITLNPENNLNWNFRHEIISSEFINLLQLDDKVKVIIQLAILGHHEKNIGDLSKVCYSENLDLLSMFGCSQESKRKSIYNDAHEGLLENWDEIILLLNYICNLYKDKFNKDLLIYKDFNKLDNATDIIEWYRLAVQNNENLDYAKLLFLKGILITCDHLGSGHNNIKSICDDIEKYYLCKFNLSSIDDFRSNQRNSITLKDSILVSPTGSGKTEASFLWVNEHLKLNNNRRIFYILPYTASINGMFYRLQQEKFSGDKVDMKHGKAVYSYFKGIIDKNNVNDQPIENLKAVEKEAKLIKQTSKEICKPIKIVTPHQIIKAFYRVKGYECLLTEFNNSLFIFDEIHCYSDDLMAMIIITMKYIKNYYNGKLFFMSATFPNVLKNIILKKLNINNEIKMTDKELAKYSRNKFNLIDSLIEDNVDLILEDIRENKRVLIVCNTIKKAQLIYKTIKESKEAKDKTIMILHSYFAQKDRDEIEERLIKGEKRKENFKPIDVLVGTQAIEVSLDLDFDTLYTELAPIDALVQRFGRVYRKRKRKAGEYGIVNICTKWDKGTEFIYNDKELRFLDKTLEILRSSVSKGDNIIDENKLQLMIDYVYDEGYKKRIEKNILEIEEKFNRIRLIPLLDYSEESEEFFNQFDGLKVCPECYIDEYEDYIKNGLYIKASSYLLSISERKLIKYIIKSEIYKTIFKAKSGKSINIYVTNSEYLDYNSEQGLIEKKKTEGSGIFF